MSMIDDLKGKAAGYLENAGKRKDELVEKAADLKNKYDENQRKKMEDWVYKKEAELKELEEELKQREVLIKEKERKLNQKFFVRFVGVAAGLSVIGFFAFASFMGTFETVKYSETPQHDISSTKSDTPEISEPYNPREASVYSTYDDIDANNPKFDVGKYCLEKEKRGDITFEECFVVAAAKIMEKQH